MKLPSGMKVKTYQARTVDEAMAQARVELGSDALLLNTRRLSENGQPSGYEVVMGITAETPSPVQAPIPVQVPAMAARPIAAAKPPAPIPANQTGVAAELERMRAQMDEIQELLVRSARRELIAQRQVPELAEIHSRLIAAEFDAVIAKDIADRLEAAMATDAFFIKAGATEAGAANRWKILAPDTGRMETFLKGEFERRISIQPRLGVDGGTQGIVSVFVGPTGGGKTTSVAKLAVALSTQHPVRVISLDRTRAGTIEQLRAISNPPHVTVAQVDALHRLPALLAEARKQECVLIDTPGLSAGDLPATETLAHVLSGCAEIDVHLVLPAYMKARDLRHTIERYKIFRPSRLLITRMDETQTFGTAFSEAARAGLALSFLGTGPRVPEDIRAASIDDLLALAMGRPRGRAQAA